MPCNVLLVRSLPRMLTKKKKENKGKRKNRERRGEGKTKEIKGGYKIKKNNKKRCCSKRSSKCALLINQSPAKQIFCQIICPKSKPWTQQAPVPTVLPTKQESKKPLVPAALLKSPCDTSPISPHLQLLYSGASNVSVRHSIGLVLAFGLG